jgi:shikimate dehydrogenase
MTELIPMKITGKTRLLAVIGDPVRHSMSPLMHNAALQELGLDFVYVALPIAGADLAAAIAGLSAIDLAGFNITLPHKQAIMPHLQGISDSAQAVGAVNTVWRSARGWEGTNTDVEGFIAPLKALDRDWSIARVICLGNGGAARAVVAGAQQLGCAAIQVFGRNVEKLAQFQTSWQGSALGADLAQRLTVHPWADLATAIGAADLIVNTTPIGMSPQIEANPLSATEVAAIRPGTIAYDLIYVPRPTQFLQQAQVQGAIAIDGLEMLVQQGAAALRIWAKTETVPVATMRRTLEQHLGVG